MQINAKNQDKSFNVDDIDDDMSALAWTYTQGYYKNSKAGLAHRVVAARARGMPLESWESVMFIDGNRDNLQRSNLKVTHRGAHASTKRTEMRQRLDLVNEIIHLQLMNEWWVILDCSYHATEQEAIDHLESIKQVQP